MALKKKIYVSILSYFVLSSILYEISNRNLIYFIYKNILKENLSFLIPHKSNEVLLSYIYILDKNFYFFIFIPILLSILILFVFQIKNVIFNENFLIKNSLKKIKEKKLNIYFYIIITAALTLFLELALIRIHSSFFQLFAFFKNFSLLSCLLGLGAGYMISDKKNSSYKYVFIFLSLQILLMFFIKNTPINAFIQNPFSERWAMGQANAAGIFQILFIFSLVILIFLFNALMFVPLGQITGSYMLKTKKLKAYGLNLIGSVLGIVLFTFLSWLSTGPIIWLLLGLTIYLIFINNKSVLISTLISFFLIFLCFNYENKLDEKTIYSPYQVLSLKYKNESKDSKNYSPVTVKANNLFFQSPILFKKDDFDTNHSYAAPFLIIDEKFDNVLIVGSGSGNDIAYALFEDVKKVTAVEIDPEIINIGLKYHPMKPYENKKVKIVVDDARNFIKKTEEKYDLIIYGLLDSHTSLSNKGGIRLDSFVYTLEAFNEAKLKLSDKGFISLTFAVPNIELGTKIFLTLKKAFPNFSPRVFKYNFNENDNQFVEGRYTFIVGNKNTTNLNIDKKYGEVLFFDKKENLKDIDISNDDWPFFYMPKKVYPKSYLIFILFTFIASYFFLNKIEKFSVRNFSPICFFLGAGFMLIETKAITELALSFGSTWFVVSIVIFLILTMAFFANYYVMKAKKINLIIVYFLLFTLIFLGLVLKDSGLVTSNELSAKILFPIILTIPMFFSGIAFSCAIKNERKVTTAVSSNILGAIFGGLIEYNSMYFGFSSLYFFGVLMYLITIFFIVKKQYI